MAYTLFYKHSVFWGQRQYVYGSPNFSLTLSLQYAWNSRIYIKVSPAFNVLSFWDICPKDITVSIF